MSYVTTVHSLRDDLLVAFCDHFFHSLWHAGSTGRCARVRLQVFRSVQDLTVVLFDGFKGSSRRPTIHEGRAVQSRYGDVPLWLEFVYSKYLKRRATMTVC